MKKFLSVLVLSSCVAAVSWVDGSQPLSASLADPVFYAAIVGVVLIGLRWRHFS